MNRTIFHQHIFPIRNKLFRFALRITGNVQEAEDVVQEVLEKVWKTSAEQAATVQNWEAWCMTITRNRSFDKTRSHVQRRTSSLERLPEGTTSGADPSRAAELNDMAGLVKRLMQDLPEKQRLVMHLRDIEELSYEEISEILDISLDQVKVNLHRARKSIREKIMLADTVTPQNT